jgi:hypothetical protein
MSLLALVLIVVGLRYLYARRAHRITDRNRKFLDFMRRVWR